MGIAELLLLLLASTPPMHSFDPEWLRPRYHYGNQALLGHYGGGDVTDAIFLDGYWFAGADCAAEGHCFHKSRDLVHWEAVPRKTHGALVYDTGGLTVDDDGTPLAWAPAGDGYRCAEATDRTLQEWHSLGTVVHQAAQTPWLPVHNATLCNPAYGQGDGYQYMDVVAPFRGSDGLWHMVAPIQGCEDRLRGVPSNPSGNRAQALLFRSPALKGPQVNWTYAGVFFSTNETVVPGRTPWVDFIDSDFFQNVPGAADPTIGVFVNSWAGGPKENCPKENCTVWNQVQWWTGRLLSNGSFAPIPGKTGAVDYGNYEPSPSNSIGIDVATNGGTQYYTCKSGGDVHGGGRRVMFSWLLEGLTGARPYTARTNVSTRALPRDLTLDGNSMLLQRPVPELKSLRMSGSGDIFNLTVTLTADARSTMLHWLPFRSNQFEMAAVFSLPQLAAPSELGVRIMASEDAMGEFSAVGLNITAPPAGLAFIDRRRGSNGRPSAPANLAPDAGADIRAGPMPSVAMGPAGVREHRLHGFVDHSTVETFWDNRTAVSAHVWPVSEVSNRLALFMACGEASGQGGCKATVLIEFWRLQSIF